MYSLKLYLLSYTNFDLSFFASFYFLIVTGSSFLSGLKNLFNPWYCFSATLVGFFNSLPNGEYSNLFNATAFSSKPFSGKTSLPVKNSFLLTFPDEKAKILAVGLSDLYWALFARFCYQLF